MTTLLDLTHQAHPQVRTLYGVIDGGGATPAVGQWGNISIPFNCTITGWVLTSDVTGSAVLDVSRGTFSGFPSVASICGTDKPTLTSAQKAENVAVSAWTTAINAGDILQFAVVSVSTITRLNLSLNITIP